MNARYIKQMNSILGWGVGAGLQNVATDGKSNDDGSSFSVQQGRTSLEAFMAVGTPELRFAIGPTYNFNSGSSASQEQQVGGFARLTYDTRTGKKKGSVLSRRKPLRPRRTRRFEDRRPSARQR